MTRLEIIGLDVRHAYAAGLDTAQGRRLVAEAKSHIRLCSPSARAVVDDAGQRLAAFAAMQ